MNGIELTRLLKSASEARASTIAHDQLAMIESSLAEVRGVAGPIWTSSWWRQSRIW